MHTKKYVAEALGTFFLVLVVALSGEPVIIGFALMVLVYFGAHISGAHYNPAVTLGAFLQKRISSRDGVWYVVSQIVGSSLAAITMKLLTNVDFTVRSNPQFGTSQQFVTETIFTFFLVYTILTVAFSKAFKDSQVYGLAIGGALMVAAFSSQLISGAVLNPAIALGSIVASTIFHATKLAPTQVALYTLAPLLGGIIASVVYTYFNTGRKED